MPMFAIDLRANLRPGKYMIGDISIQMRECKLNTKNLLKDQKAKNLHSENPGVNGLVSKIK